MDAVLRSAVIYFGLLLVLRIAGRRTLADMTNFDFILLLIIGEATQQALLGEDFSVTNGLLVIVTLVTIDIAISLWKQSSRRAERLIEGVPTVLVENGRVIPAVLQKARVREEEIMEAARRLQGLERLEQIRFAVLECSGGITVIPTEEARRR